MKKHLRVWLGVVIAALVVGVSGWYLRLHTIPVLQPAGVIGDKERNLLIFCSLLAVLIVVPVFTLLGVFAWKYREGNQRYAKYSPELTGNRMAETIWWVVPGIIVAIISVVTWQSTYALDPFKQLSSAKPTLHVQVIALDWKWLFIYPNQNIASVNEAAIPLNQPVDFEITSDAVMTSFWDPQLAGQMYAMPGMSAQQNLEANKIGSFPGWAANISGSGFARMTFTIRSMSKDNFAKWIGAAQHSGSKLTAARYAALAKPSTGNPVTYYSWVQPQLYNTTVLKYMTPKLPQLGKHTAGATRL